ncbi:hypothetical protein OSL44_24910, partial [Escherichia coli]|nr:hypothetical protein [Escherichia coli]
IHGVVRHARFGLKLAAHDDLIAAADGDRAAEEGSLLQQVLDDWLERNIQSDLKVRRAKMPGHVVIETGDVLFARN